eukprot:CAMPEP_0195522216 /NCGR_PEP_ID=MMETSP0794_2-20130614/20132_1 /TAXON_ID=515487 /ORGANISM="Stephanopyxis turris, Strain CCMP 815" /LENGTH=102 /DNA_ID=CAMNT_0040651913 /DNA_START=231 /DNA_END=537 /DNA_ORIENTATION=+
MSTTTEDENKSPVRQKYQRIEDWDAERKLKDAGKDHVLSRLKQEKSMWADVYQKAFMGGKGRFDYIAQVVFEYDRLPAKKFNEYSVPQERGKFLNHIVVFEP